MATGIGSTLSALVGPVPAQQFLRDYWPERVFHAHGPLSRLPALFSSPELLSFRALASRYQGWLGFGRGSQGSRMVSVQQVSPVHLYEMGLSVYMPDVSSSVPGAESFLRQLEADLGIAEGSSHITVWASPKDDGAPTHFDGEDVFSIQLTGTKRFEVAPMKEYAYPVGAQFGPDVPAYDDMYPQLERGFPEAVEGEFQSVDMKPGSVLFVPRGTWHRTTARQDSFAISIGIRPPSVMESFLDQLRYIMLQHPEWRRPLYGAHGNGRQRQEALERAQRVLETAPYLVQAISTGDLAPPPEPERLKNMGRATRFQREPRTRIAFDQRDEAEILHVKSWSREAGEQDTLKLNVPPQYAPTFRWLAESKIAFAAGELADRFPEVPFEQHQKILDVLTRAKYLRLLWFPQLPSR
jgi:ribosomal protein L16 Arg81 hydroxylase